MISRTGGTVLSFKVDGKDIFYPFHVTEDGKERGGMPLCAPWFGLSEFAEKKHGFLRGIEAYVAIKKKNSVILRFRHQGIDKYPWALHYTVEYSVKDGVLRTSLNTERLDDGIPGLAPVNPGFHPYFATDENTMYVLTGNDMYDKFANEAKTVSLETSSVLITQIAGKKKLVMHTRGFALYESRLVLWSDAPKNYVCVEPVLQDRKLFNTTEGIFLDEGESKELSMEVEAR